MSAPIIGIDLGTSTSEIAVLRDGRPELLQDEQGDRIVPSVVQIAPNGQVLVGTIAKSGAVTYSERTALEVKRLMGSGETVRIGDSSFRPEEVSAMILRHLVRSAEAKFGEGSVKDVVISVPARFENPAREATKRAAEMAGLNVLRLINEPTAAALSYGLDRLEDEKRVLVFDFGGGTLDVTVLEMLEGVLDVRTSVGDDRLGGKDVDALLIRFFGEQYTAKKGEPLAAADPEYLANFREKNGQEPPASELRTHAFLKQEAERYKKELSFVPQVDVDLYRLDGLSFSLTRAEFEGLIQPLVDRAMALVDTALARAGLTLADVDVILPVGGSSRIPAFRQALEARWGQPLKEYDNPDEAVARGAAIAAGIAQNEFGDEGILILDVSPHRLGTDVIQQISENQYLPDFFSELIPKDAKLPAIGVGTYTTVVDDQAAVRVRVFEATNDSTLCKQHRMIGEMFLENIPRAPAGYPIEVTFHYTQDGTVNVTAKCLYAPEVSMSQRFKVEGIGDEAQLTAAKLRLEDLWQNSEDVKRSMPLLDQAEKLMKERPDTTQRLLPITNALRSSLTSGDTAGIERHSDALTEALFELS
jgi:molecular chaperone DnaK